MGVFGIFRKKRTKYIPYVPDERRIYLTTVPQYNKRGEILREGDIIQFRSETWVVTTSVMCLPTIDGDIPIYEVYAIRKNA